MWWSGIPLICSQISGMYQGMPLFCGCVAVLRGSTAQFMTSLNPIFGAIVMNCADKSIFIRIFGLFSCFWWYKENCYGNLYFWGWFWIYFLKFVYLSHRKIYIFQPKRIEKMCFVEAFESVNDVNNAYNNRTNIRFSIYNLKW